jgi:hypothetical protein
VSVVGRATRTPHHYTLSQPTAAVQVRPCKARLPGQSSRHSGGSQKGRIERPIAQAKKQLIRDHVDHCLEIAAGGKAEPVSDAVSEFKAICRYL